MTPFSVECTTCRRRLLVRSESILGQILPCPKCGSMVLIQRPSDPSSASSGTAGAPARQTPGTADHAPANAPFDTSSMHLLEGDVDQFLSAEDPQQADTVPDPQLQQAGQLPAAARAPVQPDFAEVSTRQPPEWLSDEARLMRRWLLIGSVASAAVLILIIVLGLAWSGRQARVAEAQAAAAAKPGTTGEAQDGTTERVADAVPGGGGGDGAGDHPEPQATNPPRAVDATGDSPEPDASGGAAEEGANAGGQDVPPPSDTEDSSPAPADVSAEASAVAADAEDPAPATAERPTAVAGPRLPGLGPTARSPQALSAFDGLLADSGFDAAPVADDSPFDLIPTPQRPHDLGSALPKPAPQVTNAATQLAIRIPELDFREAQLAGLLRFAGDFTTLPVTVDADGLYRAGLSPRSPISLHATNEELQKSLSDALAPLGLRYVVDGHHLIVRLIDDDKPVEQTYEIFDLLGEGPEEGEALRGVLTSLIMPGLWQESGGSATLQLAAGRLQVNAPPAAQWEVSMFCQRLRLARGLRPQGEMPAHAPGLELRLTAALDKLAQPVSSAHAVPAPLTNILDELSTASGVDFWVNWRALEEIGWNRQTLARLEVVEQPLSEALQMLLGPMELSFRVIDASTLEITTASAAYNLLEIGFFPVRDLVAAEGAQELVERVRTALGETLVTGRGGTTVRFDASSQTLVIAAPQYQLAAVARLLKQGGG